MSYIGEVKAFVIENFLFGESDKLKENMSFLESGIIDSTGILELIGFLEGKYGIAIEDEEIIPENLDGLSKINTFLEHKLNGNKE